MPADRPNPVPSVRSGGPSADNLRMQGTWLCPDPVDRARLLEMEESLGRARAVLYGALAAGAVATGPWLGWWTVGMVLVAVTTYRILRPRIPTSPHPEYLVAGQIALAQTLLGIAIAITGGPVSPILVLTFLPVVTLPARFGPRGVYAGVAYTMVTILAATAGTDFARFTADPSLVILVLVALIGLTAFSDLLQRTEMRQRSRAIVDPLTGLLNRHALEARAREVREQASVSGLPVSLILCDVDRFKLVNDVHGHARGDAVLKEVADALRAHSRSFELIYRLGGDEFLVMLPGCPSGEASVIAERLRDGVRQARPGGLDVTVSVGFASLRGGEADFASLMEAADAGLYRAKALGRDRAEPAPHGFGELAA